MNPGRLREILGSIGWSTRDLAHFLDLNEVAPRKWTSGRTSVPDNVADWLEAIAAGPKNWKRGPPQT